MWRLPCYSGVDLGARAIQDILLQTRMQYEIVQLPCCYANKTHFYRTIFPMVFTCFCLSVCLFLRHPVRWNPLFSPVKHVPLPHWIMCIIHTLCTHYSVIPSADRPDLQVRVFIHDPHAALRDSVGVWPRLGSAYLVCTNMCAYFHLFDRFEHFFVADLYIFHFIF